MGTYVSRKVLSLIPLTLAISFLIYLGMELMPGDAVSFLMPPDALATLSPEQLEQMREALGLNDPFLVRYFNWLVGIFKGDFGYSLQSGVPVSEILMNHLPATLELSIASLLISSVLGIVLGMVSALRKGSMLDYTLDVVGMIGVAIPQFLLGLILILLLCINNNVLPVGGRMALPISPCWSGWTICSCPPWSTAFP